MSETEGSGKKKAILQRTNTVKSKQDQTFGDFADKMKKLKSLLGQVVPETRQTEVFACLDELIDIHRVELKGSAKKNQGSNIYGKQETESKEEIPLISKKSEQIILFEVREGQKVIEPIKLEAPAKSPRSNEPIVQKKLFVRFQPKKASNLQQKATLQVSPTKIY